MGQKIKGICFSSSELRGIEFYNSLFINCNFSDIDLADCKFYEVTFENCNFANAKFSSTQFRDTIFAGCKLIGVGISNANFAFSAHFNDCDLRYSEFIDVNFKGKQITSSNCNNARFRNCNFRDASLTESSFRETLFNNCDFQNADFTGAEHLFLNPSENRVKNTSIDIITAGNILNYYGFNVV